MQCAADYVNNQFLTILNQRQNGCNCRLNVKLDQIEDFEWGIISQWQWLGCLGDGVSPILHKDGDWELSR